MISICIPSYNHDPTQLVHELLHAGESIDIEILIADDASNEETRVKIEALEDQCVRIYRNEVNLGRSKSRNILAKKAQCEYLLFIDADCSLEDANKFLDNYRDDANDQLVLCGGHKYSSEYAKDTRLHYLFGTHRESRSAIERNTHPFRWVFTSNLWCPRRIALQFPFNEKLAGYGYEDNLWADDLKRAGLKLTHLDNPVIHKGLKTRSQFFKDIDQSLLQLAEQSNLKNNQEIRLNRVFLNMKNSLSGKLVLWLVSSLSNLWKWLTTYNFYTLFFLDLYKLGQINKISRRTALKARKN